MRRKNKATEGKTLTFSVPFLPPSFNAYRRCHWAVVRREEKRWKECIYFRWLELKRPRYEAIRVTLDFCFPDRRNRDLDNYLATGSKLVGDAIKGLFIPDDSPLYLKGWSFGFYFRSSPETIIKIEEVRKDG